jgi:hypothetical protein
VRGEKGTCIVAPLHFQTKKMLYLTNQKSKLNFDCTIEFISINSSKLDLTWIYLDKVTSRPTVDEG